MGVKGELGYPEGEGDAAGRGWGWDRPGLGEGNRDRGSGRAVQNKTRRAADYVIFSKLMLVVGHTAGG